MWGGVQVISIKMSRLETVNRDSIITTIDVDSEVFISSLDDWVRTIVWWLKWFANGVASDENVWQLIDHQWYCCSTGYDGVEEAE